MFTLFSLIAFRFDQSNMSINAGYSPVEVPKTETVYKFLTADEYCAKKCTVFVLPEFHKNDLNEFPDDIIENLYVFPAEQINQLKYAQVVDKSYIQNVDSTKTLIEKIRALPQGTKYFITHNDIPKEDFINYWTPGVWNALFAVVLAIALIAVSVTWFHQISVQTKFTKRD